LRFEPRTRTIKRGGRKKGRKESIYSNEEIPNQQKIINTFSCHKKSKTEKEREVERRKERKKERDTGRERKRHR